VKISSVGALAFAGFIFSKLSSFAFSVLFFPVLRRAHPIWGRIFPAPHRPNRDGPLNAFLRCKRARCYTIALAKRLFERRLNPVRVCCAAHLVVADPIRQRAPASLQAIDLLAGDYRWAADLGRLENWLLCHHCRCKPHPRTSDAHHPAQAEDSGRAPNRKKRPGNSRRR